MQCEPLKWQRSQRQPSSRNLHRQAGDTMYNRYIPQSDGTYLRRRIPDPVPPPESTPPPKPEAPCSPPHTPEAKSEPPKSPPQPPRPPRQQPQNIGSFWSNLLPKGFDTGDLIVVLLLLLMASDGGEEQNTALLTLALYLFL